MSVCCELDGVWKKQSWPCRWALMMRTTTQTLSRLAHWSPAGGHSEATRGTLVLDTAVCSITGQRGNGATWRGMHWFSQCLVFDFFCPLFIFIFYRFAVCVCVFALLVCFCQVQPAIGAGCVYIAQRLRAAIGGFKAKRQRNGNSCRCRRWIFHGLIVKASECMLEYVRHRKCYCASMC